MTDKTNAGVATPPQMSLPMRLSGLAGRLMATTHYHQYAQLVLEASGEIERLSAAAAEPAHQWDRDGERCVKCGAKDWMAGPCKRPCTCHPDDNPPRPCPQKFALSECRAEHERLSTGGVGETPRTDAAHGEGRFANCVDVDFARQLERELWYVREDWRKLKAERDEALNIVQVLPLAPQPPTVTTSTHGERLSTVATDEGYPGIAHDLETLRSKLAELCDRLAWQGPSRKENIEITVREARAILNNAAPQGSPGSISGEAQSRIADVPAVAAPACVDKAQSDLDMILRKCRAYVDVYEPPETGNSMDLALAIQNRAVLLHEIDQLLAAPSRATNTLDGETPLTDGWVLPNHKTAGGHEVVHADRCRELERRLLSCEESRDNWMRRCERLSTVGANIVQVLPLAPQPPTVTTSTHGERLSTVATDEQSDAIRQVVDRFLAWRLPQDFAPDSGITFKPLNHPDAMTHLWPVGTNLLNADQARKMKEKR